MHNTEKFLFSIKSFFSFSKLDAELHQLIMIVMWHRFKFIKILSNLQSTAESSIYIKDFQVLCQLFYLQLFLTFKSYFL